MYSGIKAMGDRPRLFVEADYREPLHDVAVFYGFTQTLRRIGADYEATGRPWVYIDLGYWGREGLTGHHKIVVNARHPTEYFLKRRQRGDRAALLGVDVKQWRDKGKHILLAGMGAKAADAEGIAPEKWERDAIEWINGYSSRQIVYRPKPSWVQSKPIPGTVFSWGGEPRPGFKKQFLAEVLAGCHAVVTHHSNVAVEALVAGVPAFCWKGVAQPMTSQDLRQIEAPMFPDNREDWVNAIAYTQWNIAEMSHGTPWRHLKNEGLID